VDVAAIVRLIEQHLADRAVFIGGVAVESYVPYRTTHDIDVVTRDRDFPTLKAALLKASFSHRETHLAKHWFKSPGVGEVNAYTSRIGDLPIDEDLMRRARKLAYANVPVTVASLEDLLRLKLKAGREMDLADVAVLLHARHHEINLPLVERLVGQDLLPIHAQRVPDLLPEEYGWQARQALKSWLIEVGWLERRRKGQDAH
jgi:hypothetical protein